MAIGKRIAVYRRLRGLSQNVVGAAAGRTQPWVSMVERGELEPQRAQVRRIERLLDVPLFDDKEFGEEQ